ncbi:serine protease inhibitor Kazal-type 1-like isoform X2 [Leguminivora glycinivorella]|uniref:serine protease inhibitor Kazal-type 1-like isoform X2 n=1 Tax=Leguminivora glycinivorella TaxID=1035111 RepID=UPI00200D7FEB|nr:serine protease inhibitor Kazal-type 1-like isoform X2 [Leguminivora glycinivorella]XP_047992369.1 serine protease inhibitor Kazal-type 1-like isoform X2 [Leguminivora glycinivorella]XP_047992370.1 serine protease inhibitor Kazal-type 1-like isoform X2 [Leguminivora glycinivorella]
MKLILVCSLLTVLVSAHENYPPTPSCPCGRVYMPLCASNGVTYNNMCEFECAHRHLAQMGYHIGVIREGRCEEPSGFYEV